MSAFFYGRTDMAGLSDAAIKQVCPAVFATAPRGDVSNRYGFVETAPLLAAMRANGFIPVEVRHHNRRDMESVPFTKHMIRFRTKGGTKTDKPQVVGDVVPQIVLVNSHDRSSRFELYCGLFRLVCSNGLLVSDGNNVAPKIVRHTTSSVDGLLDAAGELIKSQKMVFEHVDAMKKTVIDENGALRFAKEALSFRPTRAGIIEYKQLLVAKRPGDEAMNVWHVYNRVQENLMKGGMRGTTGDSRAVVTRGVEAINPIIDINAKLWELAMRTVAKAETKALRA